MVTIYGMARLFPIFIFLPYMNSQMLGGMLVKNVIIIFIVIGFMPRLLAQYPDVMDVPFAVVIIKEALIGLVCGFAMAIPFWTVLAIGEIIDNQRGATISSTMNPGIGVDASFMATFMNFYFAAIFVINDGMTTIVKTIYESYLIFPLNTSFKFDLNFVTSVIRLLKTLMSTAIVLVGPVVITLFLIEVSIGILSRFAPQLNAFSVALSVKSFFAFLILLIYLTPVLTPQILSVNVVHSFFEAMN